MPNEMEMPEFPRLKSSFFSVCSTAIKATAWQRADFETVQQVEAQLALLNEFVIAMYVREQANGNPLPDNPVNKIEMSKSDDKAEVAAEPVNEPKTLEISEKPASTMAQDVSQPPTIQPENNSGLITPEEAKKAPTRPMPAEILDIVKDTMEIAKNPPKVHEVKVDDIPDDPDAARAAWNKPW